uniref:Uncharacterized protein n=1 Tax=Magnetococcus massalia (strain MO-1) TaxID=451514 RepID=A0A1S7LM58_MAGMO|nr:protein of unknown function [Candidatus Magnetococcus massalia]
MFILLFYNVIDISHNLISDNIGEKWDPPYTLISVWVVFTDEQHKACIQRSSAYTL